MTRTSSLLILALVTLGAAIAAAPAAASDSYRSINSITGGDGGQQGQSLSSDYTSLTAAVGADSSEPSPVTSANTDPSSLNSVLATAPEGRPVSPGPGSGYRSVSAIVGGSAQPQSTELSVNALVGADSSEPSPVTSADTDPSSLNSVLATAPEGGSASSGTGSDYRSVNAIVGGGSPQPSPTAVVEVPDGDGFDWLDALVGGLIASGLMLMTLAAARSVARHRRATVESSA